MAARAARNRGLWRCAYATASANEKTEGSESGVGSESTLRIGSTLGTFDADIATRARTPASVSCGGRATTFDDAQATKRKHMTSPRTLRAFAGTFSAVGDIFNLPPPLCSLLLPPFVFVYPQ